MAGYGGPGFGGGPGGPSGHGGPGGPGPGNHGGGFHGGPHFGGVHSPPGGFGFHGSQSGAASSGQLNHDGYIPDPDAINPMNTENDNANPDRTGNHDPNATSSTKPNNGPTQEKATIILANLVASMSALLVFTGILSVRCWNFINGGLITFIAFSASCNITQDIFGLRIAKNLMHTFISISFFSFSALFLLTCGISSANSKAAFLLYVRAFVSITFSIMIFNIRIHLFDLVKTYSGVRQVFKRFSVALITDTISWLWIIPCSFWGRINDSAMFKQIIGTICVAIAIDVLTVPLQKAIENQIRSTLRLHKL